MVLGGQTRAEEKCKEHGVLGAQSGLANAQVMYKVMEENEARKLACWSSHPTNGNIRHLEMYSQT